MGFFTTKKAIPSFNSRAAAFDFAFAEAVEDGMDMLEAAEKANKFADIVATNKGLPPTPPQPKNAIETAVSYAKQIASIKQENPEVWELVTGAAGGLISGFALLTSPQVQQQQAEATPEEINFEDLK
jgi:hypothetical protein